MQIILLDKVVNLGNLGEIVKVKDGYARNFLIPSGRARRATAAAIAEFEARRAELEKAAAEKLARRLVTQVRAGRSKASGVDALMHEFSLSSEEGVALMCLAEALLRIPDNATRNKLIQDKLSGGNWQSHLNHSPSLFVNAAAWGLLITGKLTAANSGQNLGSALTRVVGKGGEPLIRKGVDYAMRLLGKQFVTGQTIEEALKNGKEREKSGYRFSFDMLGEAAMTQADADRFAVGEEGHGLAHDADPQRSVQAPVRFLL